MYILKFGGTSLANPEMILKTIDITKEKIKSRSVIVVVSAFSGVTDTLEKLANSALQNDENYRECLVSLEERHLNVVKDLIDIKRQSNILANINFLFKDLLGILQGVFLIRELSPKTIAYILSFGERLSAYIMSYAYREEGVFSQFTDSREIIFTDGNYKNVVVDFETTNAKIRAYFKDNTHHLHIVTGFIASTPKGKTTTLERGGSDYTASILAAALDAERLEIWTDVNGIMSAPPRQVKKAITIFSMNYLEAMEMSYFGAKVLHAQSIQPVARKKIPVFIKNTRNPNHSGTLITENSQDKQTVKGISSIPDMALVTLSGSGITSIKGSASQMFRTLSENNINIVLISQASSEHSISIGIKQKVADLAKEALTKEFSKGIEREQINIKITKNVVISAIVGSNMRQIPGISAKLFRALGRSGINILAIAQGSSEMNISFVIEEKYERKSLNVIHEAFFLSHIKKIHLFLIGIGQIGKTLIEQIIKERSKLLKDHHLEISLMGLSNSKKMYLDSNEIPLEKAFDYLKEKGETANLNTFVEVMVEYNLRNSVFIDCTASSLIISKYEEILNKNISITTPNKIACSSKFAFYQGLKEIAAKRDIQFLYETNVGAGLPILSTIESLVKSGDKILKIEAILSGTLNYIFNHVSSSNPFSTVVKDAKEKGLTEPDPRVDLGLIDVARKILIIARETGYSLEFDDVQIESFIPKKYLTIENVNDFLNNLSQYDDFFKEKILAVEKENKKYTIVASLEEGKAKVSLQAIDSTHPFFNVEGSDNIFLFKTERYKDSPLIIQGAGAGAEVTAAGIFADILRIVDFKN